MKQLNVLLLLLFVLSFTACDRHTYNTANRLPIIRLQDGAGSNFDWESQIVEVDGCEYLAKPGGEAGWMTHKGNCKYCAGAPRPAKPNELEKVAQPLKP